MNHIITPSDQNQTAAKFYTRKQIASVLGVRHETVSRWASAGVLPSAIRVGKRVLRYDLTEVLEYLKNNKIKTGGLN